MTSNHTIKFFIFLLIIAVLFKTTTAQEQNITISTEIVDGTLKDFLYSEKTKQIIIGSTITLMTIATGIGIYHLLKLW